MKKTILVRGANDIGSAVAQVLFIAGYSVSLHETSQPTTVRRRMSFTDAVFDGYATLENVTAKLVDIAGLTDTFAAHAVIPVCINDFSMLLEALRPNVLIDARMRKHQQPETQRGLAPLTIGLGPNFIAGETVDLGIETGWDALGRIVRRGATNPLAGEPRAIAGHARDRYVYAPGAGIFHTAYQIGDMVEKDDVVAQINSIPLPAPISGMLRGLTRDGVPVHLKTKVIEIDPRATGAEVTGIAERPARIAQGVLEAIENPMR
jgi:xanthine dehydrogenase accessory factor